jgi:hypothetical protein
MSDIGVNLGKAMASVSITDALKASNFYDQPLIQSQEFLAASETDLSAMYGNSEAKAFNIDSITIKHGLYPSEKGSVGNFGAIFPKAKYYQVHNFLSGFTSGDSELPSKRIEWKVPPKENATLCLAQKPYVKDFKDEMSWEVGPNYSPDYLGPRWTTTTEPKRVFDPTDQGNLLTGNGSTDSSAAKTPSVNIFDLNSTVVAQESIALPNMFWGIQTSTLDLPVNFPFYVDIYRSQRINKDVTSFLTLRLNPNTAGEEYNSFDIILAENQQPKIFDVTQSVAQKEAIKETFSEVDPSVSSSDFIRIGIMPVFGRLVVYVNGNSFIYGRQNYNLKTNQGSSTGAQSASGVDSFAIIPFKLKMSAIEVWGNNCMCKLSMGFMSFPTGSTGLPVEANLDKEGNRSNSWDSFGKGMPYYMDNSSIGHCAKEFRNGDSIIANNVQDDSLKITCPNGMGQIAVKMFQTKSSKKDYAYRLLMRGSDATLVNGKVTISDSYGVEDGTKMPCVGPPFLFRLRGYEDLSAKRSRTMSAVKSGNNANQQGSPRSFYMANKNKQSKISDISDDIISISRTFSAPDLFHSEQSAEITIYNDGGKNDELVERVKGIQISMGWNTPKLVFTGVAIGGSRSELAGKETLVIHCEDYNRILDDTEVVNSPYYDGMDAYYAFDDLSRQAGIISQDDTGSTRYYLPCGYSFTSPRYKIEPSGTSIKEALIDIAKRSESCFYFDETGSLHYSSLQGSLFFEDGFKIASSFYRDPLRSSDGFNIVLQERKVDYKVGDVVNTIVVRTIDRTSGGQFIHAVAAKQSQNLIPYKRIWYKHLPALASKEACVQWTRMISERMFKVPLGVSITTCTKDVLTPLCFIEVDGHPFRLTNISETLNAEDNSYVTNLTADWYGVS